MNIVVDNFSTTNDTQSLYIAHTLTELGHRVIVPNPSLDSIYDIMDKHNPDIYITHASVLSKDLIFYLENNPTCKTDMLLCVNTLQAEHIAAIDKFINTNNIKSSFFFTHSPVQNLPKLKNNVIALRSAADLNLLNKNPNVEYSIDKAIFVYNKESIKTYDGCYHIITTNSNIKNEVDICLPEVALGTLYKYYDHIIFRDNIGYLTQPFFDAIMMGAKVYFDIDDDDQKSHFETMIKQVFQDDIILNYNAHNKLNDFSKLKNHILEKHTNKNRVKTLLSNIKKDITNE
jgi:hypothetical protein